MEDGDHIEVDGGQYWNTRWEHGSKLSTFARGFHPPTRDDNPFHSFAAEQLHYRSSPLSWSLWIGLDLISNSPVLMLQCPAAFTVLAASFLTPFYFPRRATATWLYLAIVRRERLQRPAAACSTSTVLAVSPLTPLYFSRCYPCLVSLMHSPHWVIASSSRGK